MDSITQIIAEYASTLAFEHLTAEAVHAAKQRLIDSLGCAVGAYDCEPALGRARSGAAFEIWWRLEQEVGVSTAMQLLEIDR